MARVVGVGLLGLGTVGSGVLDLLAREGPVLERRWGLRFEVRRALVRDPGKPRRRGLNGQLTTDPRAVLADPAVDIVVEAMGGVEPARSLILATLDLGKPVVTANKEVMAAAGWELFRRADATGAAIGFEATVGGAVPVIKAVKLALAGDRLRQVRGVINGTTNYVLTAMETAGLTRAQALAEARARGYAEADATADVEGRDAACKLSILASVCFGTRVSPADVPRRGIGDIRPADLAGAMALGYRVRLVARAEDQGERLVLEVAPAAVPEADPLARLDGARNGVVVVGDACGELFFSGPGAGGLPTAAAVVGDLVVLAWGRYGGGRGLPGCTCYRELAPAGAEEPRPGLVVVAPGPRGKADGSGEAAPEPDWFRAAVRYLAGAHPGLLSWRGFTLPTGGASREGLPPGGLPRGGEAGLACLLGPAGPEERRRALAGLAEELRGRALGYLDVGPWIPVVGGSARKG